MKKTALMILSLILSLLLISGCAPSAQQNVDATPAPAVEATPDAVEPTPDTSATPAPAQTTAAERDRLNVIALKGPTGMGMVHLMQQAEMDATSVDYHIELASAPDEISGKLITGEMDIAAAPINLASVLYNKTEGKTVLIAINTMGVLYILDANDEIKSMADLAGKKLYATGQASTPEYILNYLLEQNGLSGKVEIEYKTDHAELATLVAAGEVGLAMLPEPNVTAALMKNENLKVALDLTSEWNRVAGGTMLVQGCIVVRRDVLENNKQAVDTFLAEYAASTEFTNAQPQEAAKLIEQYGILGSAQAAERAIPQCHIVCITGEGMKNSAKSMLNMLFRADPKSVGGSLPEDDFYYTDTADA